MKRYFIAAMVLSIVLILAASLNAETFRSRSLASMTARHGEVRYVEGEVLVGYKAGVSPDEMAAFTKSVGAVTMSAHRGGTRRPGAAVP